MTHLLCALGLHTWVAHYSHARGRYMACAHCPKTATPRPRVDDSLAHELARHA